MKIIEYLKTARNIRLWDRTPAISDKELDELIAQAEPAEATVHGAWIDSFDCEETGRPQKVFECSVCKKTEFTKPLYCPHCWAKMDMKG